MVRYAPQSLGPDLLKDPITVTPEEYERDWKPKGWRLIIIGPTSTWREEWGEWEAIRDIVQNCLDESEAYTYGYDNDGLWIADKGKGVAVSDFLLGPAVVKPEWARGRFGEGLKIGCLALLRRHVAIRIQTVNREIRVIFTQQQVNGRVKTLAALWRPNGTRAGTKFHLIGYDGSTYAEHFAVNLPPSLILAVTPSPITKPVQRYNQIIRAEGMAKSDIGGVIYCRDIYLLDLYNSPFSYNLWGFALAPDRHAPAKEMDMWADMGRTWACVKNVALLKQFINMVTDPPELRTAETGNVNMEYMGKDPTSGDRYSDVMLKNRAVWQQAWDQTQGKDAVVRRNERLDSMVQHLGYRSVSLQFLVRERLGEVIKTDKQLVQEMAERLSETDIIPDSKLTIRQYSHLKLARAVTQFFGSVTVKAAIIPPASDMVGRTAGLYEFDASEVKINAEMLQWASETVGVMVHELGHHIAYIRSHSREEAGDLTTGHSNAMEFVAGAIFSKLAEGKLDEYLKECIW